MNSSNNLFAIILQHGPSCSSNSDEEKKAIKLLLKYLVDRLLAFGAPVNVLSTIDLTSNDDEKFEPDAHSTKIKD